MDTRFFDVPSVHIRCSSGEADMPIRYRDGAAVTAIYTAPGARVAQRIAWAGLSPVTIRDRALVAITWFEYLDTTIGPYNELSIAVLVAPSTKPPRVPWLRVLRGDADIGAYVLELPVTTEMARAAGVELYGYPKILADIKLRFSGTELEAELRDQGHPVLGMRLPLGKGRRRPMRPVTTYSVLGNHLIQTRIDVDCEARIVRGKGTASLVIHDTEHRVGRTLHDLGLSGAPLATLYTDPFRSLLPIGRPIARVLGNREEEPNLASAQAAE